MRALLSGFVIIVGVFLFLLYNSIFIVQQTEQALVLQFGDIQRVEKEPGLKFKIPFIQNIRMFDKRLLFADMKPVEFNAEDKELNISERIVIDAYVTYRVTDPLKFYQAVKDENGLTSQLDPVVESSLRRTIGSVSLRDLLSAKRQDIMEQVRDEINRKVSGVVTIKTGDGIEVVQPGLNRGGFGIEVADVRIMRTDLPQEVSQSTFERMRSDFEKEAKKFRAEGEERAVNIRSAAERERSELLAEANKKGEVIRGEGDGIATKTYAEAFSKDEQFFDFYRSMQAYQTALKNGEETTVVLSPDSAFFKHMD